MRKMKTMWNGAALALQGAVAATSVAAPMASLDVRCVDQKDAKPLYVCVVESKKAQGLSCIYRIPRAGEVVQEGEANSDLLLTGGKYYGTGQGEFGAYLVSMVNPPIDDRHAYNNFLITRDVIRRDDESRLETRDELSSFIFDKRTFQGRYKDARLGTSRFTCWPHVE